MKKYEIFKAQSANPDAVDIKDLETGGVLIANHHQFKAEELLDESEVELVWK